MNAKSVLDSMLDISHAARTSRRAVVGLALGALVVLPAGASVGLSPIAAIARGPPACTVNGQTLSSTAGQASLNSNALLYQAEGQTLPTNPPNKWENNLATTPAPLLTAGMVGIASTDKGTTGSSLSPKIADKFAAGWLEESELYEYLNNATSGPAHGGVNGTNVYSPGQYQSVFGPPLSTLPTGTVTHTDATSSTGRGLPYAEILSKDLSTVIATVPVTVTYENYTPQVAAFMPPQGGANNQPTATCTVSGGGPLFSMMTFDTAPLYSKGTLSKGTTYAAYLVVSDTDVSGPLSDHLWYFTTPMPTVATVSRLSRHYAHGATTLRWYSPEHVLGFNVFVGSSRLNRRLIISTTRWYTFKVRGAYAKRQFRLVAVTR